MSTDLYPLLFEPVYKDYIWGGSRIPKRYGRAAPPQPAQAESWELSDRDEGMSVVANGPLAGTPLRDLMRRRAADIAGRAVRPPDRFPLLVKLIDARQRLSVQVHPDDETARVHGGEAKTEMWYVLDADPGARVFIGLKPGCDESAFRQALAAGTVESLLASVPAVPGETVFVPGGRVHAIGEGCLLLEVQQNSNTTYRVYDWGRVDAQGRPRELHVEQAIRVIRWSDPHPVRIPCPPDAAGAAAPRVLLDTPHFRVARIDLAAPADATDLGGAFHALFVQDGRVTVSAGAGAAVVGAGATCLVPAAVGRYRLTPAGGRATVVRIMA